MKARVRSFGGVPPLLGGLLAVLLVAPAPAAAQLRLQRFVGGLTLPTGMVQDPTDPTVQYVLEKGFNQSGRGPASIRVVQNGVLRPEPFLTLQVQSTSECGMLGLAFAPDYATSRRAYVFHCLPQNTGDVAVSRFLRDAANPLRLDPATRKDFEFPRTAGDPGTGATLPYIYMPEVNHKGGRLLFGPDGFLYVSVGDAKDPAQAQRIDTLRGKILRLDVTGVPLDDARGYRTPPDNPYVASGGLPEIWDIGLRNPWRFTFDLASRGGSNALIIADVGEELAEEVNYEPAGRGGRNYQWPLQEGRRPGPGGVTPGPGPLLPPVFDYTHDYGRAIAGGHVYRGTALPAQYVGRYFFADFVFGKIGSLAFTVDATGEATAASFIDHSPGLVTGSNFSSVDLDAAGELYFVSFEDGIIYKLVFDGPPPPPPPPPPPNDTDQDGLADDWEAFFGATEPNVDLDSDGLTNLQEFQAGSHPNNQVALTRYFAEGANSAFFDTTLAIANAGDLPATANLRFLTATGQVVSQPLLVPPRRRVTVHPADNPALASTTFATTIETNNELAIERTMVWPKDVRYGSHTEVAARATSPIWYLAEGSTLGDFSLYYLIENPNDSATPVQITYLRPAPLPPIVTQHQAAANARLTIDVKADDPALASENVSAIISVPSGPNAIIAERAMYLTGNGQLWRAGHVSMGVTAPATQWFFAEGATGSFFDMFLLLANPGDVAATATVQFLRPGGLPPIVLPIEVAAHSRWTENVENLDPALAAETISIAVSATQPIVAERSIYWPGLDQGGWQEGSNAPGATQTGQAWVIADAELGGPFAAETFALIANTSPFPGQARVTLLREDATTVTPLVIPLEASSRTTVPDLTGVAGGQRFSILIESLPAAGSADVPAIVVERASYSSDANGVVWSAGGTALATRLR